MSKQQTRPGFDPKKVSGELFTLTYGAFVVQLIKDYDRDEDVNNQLEKIGYNMGLRLIDDFLSKNINVNKCNDFRETADVLAKHAFKAYLGIVPTVTSWSPGADEFSLIFDTNPLTEFVEIPPETHPELRYSQVLCGVIRGALEMVHLEVQSWFVQDQMRGDATNEIRVKYVRKLEESVPVGED